MKNRYDYSTEVIYLKSNSQATTPTINFTLVTKNPLEAYNLLNNQTLSYVRDTIQCVTNDYSVGSNVLEVITSSSFGTYQAFGFLLVIINLLLLCLVLAKLDLPKVMSLVQFDDNFYTPIYSWLLINMAIASLTSCTYLVYGGLFSLKLDPCISRTLSPSLAFLLKKMNPSFNWRFVWIYIGMVIAYILITFLLIRPKTKMPTFLYVIYLILYLGGIGARSLGNYSMGVESTFGACGELLSLIAGAPLLVIDILVSCRIRTINNKDIKSNGNNEANEVSEVNVTEIHFNTEI